MDAGVKLHSFARLNYEFEARLILILARLNSRADNMLKSFIVSSTTPKLERR